MGRESTCLYNYTWHQSLYSNSSAGSYSDIVGVSNKEYTNLDGIYFICYANGYVSSNNEVPLPSSFSGSSTFVGLTKPTPTPSPTVSIAPTTYVVTEIGEVGDTLEARKIIKRFICLYYILIRLSYR